MQIAIVVDKNFPKSSLTKDEVRAIFLSKKRFIHQKKILVMNYKPNSIVRECFEKNILKKSKSSLNRYWLKAYYQGKRPPKVITSYKMLLLYLNRVTPAIGYTIIQQNLEKKVKIVFKIECEDL